MKKILNSPIFNGLLIVLIGLLVVSLSLNQNFDETFKIIREANVSWLLLAVVFSVAMYLVWGYALQVYTRLLDKKISLLQGFNLSLVGAFGSGITPSSTGGQFFQVMAFRKMGVNVTSSASILWIDFLLYQIVMIIMVLVLLFLRLSHFLQISGLFSMVILGFILNSFVLVFLFVLAKSRRFHNWLAPRGIKILHRLKIVKDKEKTMERIENALTKFSQCLNVLTKNKKVVLIGSLMNFIRLILLFSLPYVIGRALNAPIGIRHIYDIIALSSFVMMINVFVPLPGASGGTELTFVGMFSTIVDAAYLAPLMLVWRFMTYYLVMLVGASLFIHYKRKGIE